MYIYWFILHSTSPFSLVYMERNASSFQAALIIVLYVMLLSLQTAYSYVNKCTFYSLNTTYGFTVETQQVVLMSCIRVGISLPYSLYIFIRIFFL